MTSLHTWPSFLWTADEFIIAYASAPLLAGAAPLFMIGHAAELYLKAANTKITGDIDRAVGFGHRMKDLWNDCKSKDPLFMPNYELREAVYKEPFLEEDITGLFSQNDAVHYLKNQDFYIVAKHLMDIKYFGAPLKTIKRPYAYSTVFQNPYWIDFFKELRSYLGHPLPGTNDGILNAIEHGEVSLRAQAYLKELYK
jgi:hypothetical protein